MPADGLDGDGRAVGTSWSPTATTTTSGAATAPTTAGAATSASPAAGATLGPLDERPFYAVESTAARLGTKGGPRTNVDGAVLDVDGTSIPGLYAAGNVMAAPTGMVYGGAGGTLGPAMVFGYLAGCRAAADA